MNYFRSNESDIIRKLSKWLTLLITLLTGLLAANIITGKILHDVALTVNIISFVVKIILPMFGSNDNDLKALKANCGDTVNQTVNK
jgi:hypothetical protein